jgi:PAS domain S-box-containing protein
MGLKDIGGDVEEALENVNVPSYVIDVSGVIRWLNPAARRLVGECRGRQFTSVVAADQKRYAREVFAQKVAGTIESTNAETVLIDADGDRIDVEVCSVALRRGHRLIGVFGQIPQATEAAAPAPHPHLTPRQAEILHHLQHGHSTAQIAAALHLSPETVRNHVKHLLRSLGVNSRLEAVALMRQQAAVT